jgi:hypothetical protein
MNRSIRSVPINSTPDRSQLVSATVREVEADRHIEQRLNPLAFPDETRVRFTLFALAALTWVMNWVPVMVGVISDLLAGQAVTVNTDPWLIVWPLAVLSLAVVLYLAHPARIRRTGRLIPLDAQKDALLISEVARLSQLAQVTPAPRVLVRKSDTTSGQAFGLPGRYTVRLDSGLRIAVRRAPQIFRAVVLHELAHLATGDIGRTYFGQALWLATAILAIAPFIIALLLYVRNPPGLLLILTPLLGGVGIVYLIRASLLRVRETYADWRAAHWGAVALRSILQQAASREQPQAWHQRLSAQLRLHPTATDRLAHVTEPVRFFQMMNDVPFFVGWLMTVIIFGASLIYLRMAPQINTLVSEAITYLQQVPFDPNSGFDWPLTLARLLVQAAKTANLLPIVIIGYWVMGSLGLQVLRETTAQAARREHHLQHYVRLLLLAVWTTLGLYVGLLTLPFMLSNLAQPDLWAAPLLPLALTAALIWISLCGLRYWGWLLLGSYTGVRPPIWRRRILTAIFSLLLSVVLFEFISGILANAGVVIAGTSGRITGTDVDVLTATATSAFELFVIIGLGILIGGVLLNGWLKLRPRRCPACRQIVPQSVVVGQVCPHCHAELAAWLLIDSDAVPETSTSN